MTKYVKIIKIKKKSVEFDDVMGSLPANISYDSLLNLLKHRSFEVAFEGVFFDKDRVEGEMTSLITLRECIMCDKRRGLVAYINENIGGTIRRATIYGEVVADEFKAKNYAKYASFQKNKCGNYNFVIMFDENMIQNLTKLRLNFEFIKQWTERHPINLMHSGRYVNFEPEQVGLVTSYPIKGFKHFSNSTMAQLKVAKADKAVSEITGITYDPVILNKLCRDEFEEHADGVRNRLGTKTYQKIRLRMPKVELLPEREL